MRAWVWEGEAQVVLGDRDPEPLREGWVRLAPVANGICATDFELIRGQLASSFPPLVPGHEVVADVVEGDASIVGARVVLDTMLGCGECSDCLSGHTQRCAGAEEFGLTIDGGWRETMAVPIRNCHEIPPSISAETATLIEPLSCELGAVRSCQIGPADHVLVVGSGVAALLFVQLARLEGPRKVVSAVNRDLHVPLAQRLGADEVLVNPGLDEVTARYSTSIDAVGSDASLALAVRALAPGGHLVLYGLRDRTPTFPLHEAIFKNITVSAHTSAPWLWRDAISLVETGDVALEPLVSDVVPFEGIGRCMSASLLGGPGPRTKLKVVALHDG